MKKGTFNTISLSGKTKFGGNVPVWARIYRRLVSGGYFDLTTTNPYTGKRFAAGDLIPAGTMISYEKPGGKLTIVSKTESDLTKVKGLLDNDVLIPEDCKLATGAVVISGRIYADRVACALYDVEATPGDAAKIGLPAGLEQVLPMIEFVREA